MSANKYGLPYRLSKEKQVFFPSKILIPSWYTDIFVRFWYIIWRLVVKGVECHVGPRVQLRHRSPCLHYIRIHYFLSHSFRSPSLTPGYMHGYSSLKAPSSGGPPPLGSRIQRPHVTRIRLLKSNVGGGGGRVISSPYTHTHYHWIMCTVTEYEFKHAIHWDLHREYDANNTW